MSGLCLADGGIVSAAAASAGYTQLVFDDEFDTDSVSPDGTGGYNWYPTQPFGFTTVPRSEWAVDGGFLVLANSVGQGLGTAGFPGPGGKPYVGRAWQHAYVEASIRFDPVLAAAMAGGPSFWSLSVEHAVGNGGAPDVQTDAGPEWSGIDFFLTDNAPAGTFGGSTYDVGVHDFVNWKDALGSTSRFDYPTGFDFSQFHTYGALWAAPADNGGTGYAQWFLDGAPGPKITWQPGGTRSIVDANHQFLVLGADARWPLTVDWVRVWQKPAAPASAAICNGSFSSCP